MGLGKGPILQKKVFMKKGILLAFLSIFFIGKGIAQQTPVVPDDSTVVKQLIGKYTFPEGSVITEVDVAVENGALTMTSSAGNSPLDKQGEDLYAIVQFQGTAKFIRNAEKKVMGVSIVAMGYILEGVKTVVTTTTYSVPVKPIQKNIICANHTVTAAKFIVE